MLYEYTYKFKEFIIWNVKTKTHLFQSGFSSPPSGDLGGF